MGNHPPSGELSLFDLLTDADHLCQDLCASPQASNLMGSLQRIQTDLVGIEKALRQQMERTRTYQRINEVVTQGAPIIIFMVNRDGVVMLVEGRPDLLERVVPTSQPLGRSLYDLYADEPVVLGHLRDALAGETVTFHFQTAEMLLRVYFSPLYDSGGVQAGLVGTALDITLQNAVEQALQDSETRFQVLFEEAPLGMLLLTPDRRILLCNPAANEIFGAAPGSLIGQDYLDLLPQPEEPAFQTLFADLLAGRLPSDRSQGEKLLREETGNLTWVRETLSILRDGSGQPLFAIALLENITSQKQAEQERSELEQRLLDGREAERTHLARELHDGPLQDLYAVTYLLTDLEVALSSKEAQIGYRQVQRQLAEVINNLRGVARDLRPPSLAQFGLEKGLRTHADRIRTEHPNVRLELRLDSDAETLPDRVRLVLFRIYQQAVINALRHAEPTRLEIIFRLEPQEILLEIRDNGQGFHVPQRWLELLRAGHFGLVGSAERAHSIGGWLEVQSAPGEGTVIRVRVPIDEQRSFLPHGRMSAYVNDLAGR